MKIANKALFPLFRDGDLIVDYGPTALTVSTDSAVGQQFVLYGSFEAVEVSSAIGAALPGTTVIDVGANIGLMTLPLVLHGQAQVWAVEPLQTNVEKLRQALPREVAGKVEVIQTALGAEPGEVSFDLLGDGALATVSDEGSDGVWPVTTLDALWQDRGEPTVSLIKVDVEGYEPQVLSGAVKLLTACRPTVMVEVRANSVQDRVSAVLGPLGYRLTQPRGFSSYNYLAITSPS